MNNVQWYDLPEDPNEKIPVEDNPDAFSRIGVLDAQIYFAVEAYRMTIEKLLAAASEFNIMEFYTLRVSYKDSLSGYWVGSKTIREIISREHPEQLADFDVTIRELWEEIFNSIRSVSYAS